MNNKSDTSFWKLFAKKYWKKKPAFFPGAVTGKGPFGSLALLDADQVFSMLLDFAKICRRKKNPQGFKLFIDGQLQYKQETLELLPKKSDRSLAGYHARMDEMFADYCLVCDELLQVSGPHWQTLRQFLNGLFSATKDSPRFVEMGLYLGNYRKTPFGIHLDACGVFSIPVVGTKRFRLWDPEYIEARPRLQRAHHYRPHLKASTLMKLSPGDLGYWPSQSWHIAESDGSFSATWSLGVWDRSTEAASEDLLKEASVSYLKGGPPSNLTVDLSNGFSPSARWRLKKNLKVPWSVGKPAILNVGFLNEVHTTSLFPKPLRFLESLNAYKVVSLRQFSNHSFESQFLQKLICTGHMELLEKI